MAVTIRAGDVNDIKSGLSLPVVVSDGKYKEEFVVTVQRCTCDGSGDKQCNSPSLTEPIPKAQVRPCPKYYLKIPDLS